MEPEIEKGATSAKVSAPFSLTSNSDISSVEIPCKSIVTKFLSSIAGDEPVTFQTLGEGESRNDQDLNRTFHGMIDEHFESLKDLNDRGAGIFFTVNQTDLKGRTTRNITRVRALYIDLDGASLGPILEGPLNPHLIVETSPHRYHVYWIVEEVPLDHFSAMQKTLIKRFNSDPAVCDLPRLMRIPGFLHQKGEPFFAKVIWSSELPPYTVAQFLGAFNADESQESKQLEADDFDPILEELYGRGMVRGPISGKSGGWHVACFNEAQHTTGPNGAAYFTPGSNGFSGAGYKCMHAHCAHLTIRDLREFLEVEKEWEEPRPFEGKLAPVEALHPENLPEAIKPWITDIASRMQVPLDFLAAPCLVILGSLIGRKYYIYPKANDNWSVHPNLWGAIIGRPATMKSPAMAEMMRPLEKLETDAFARYESELQSYERQMEWVEVNKATHKEEMKNALRNKTTVVGSSPFPKIEIPPKPTLRRYKTEDCTVQKLAEILKENPQGILIYHDELMGLLVSLDAKGHEGDRAFYNQSWNAQGSFNVDRIGRGTSHIKALCTSIIGGIQPGPLMTYVYQAKTGGVGDDGFLQRFQILVWPEIDSEWVNVDREPDIKAELMALEVFQRFDAFEPTEPFEPSEPTTRGSEAKALRFETEAQQLFNQWRENLEHRLRNEELEPAFESHLGKYRSLMPKLALLFYLIDTLGIGVVPVAVDVKATKLAIEWCSYLESHAKRVYTSGANTAYEAAQILLEKIQGGDLGDEFTSRDVYNSRHWSKLDNSKKVNAALDVLEEYGWVRREKKKVAGVKSSIKVIVHPQLRRSS